MAACGWRPMFAVFGIGTLLWVVPWRGLTGGVRDTPAYVEGGGVPMSLVWRQPALWVISLCHFSSNYGVYFLQTWLPLYLIRSRGF